MCIHPRAPFAHHLPYLRIHLLVVSTATYSSDASGQRFNGQFVMVAVFSNYMPRSRIR